VDFTPDWDCHFGICSRADLAMDAFMNNKIVAVFATVLGLFMAQEMQAALNGTTLISDARINTMKSRIASGINPTYSAWLKMKIAVDSQQFGACQAPTTWNVPGGSNPTHDAYQARIDHDSSLVYELALAYRITGNETYATNCARILTCWATKLTTLSTAGVSTLMWSNRFPNMIVAADLISNSPRFTITQQQGFKSFVRKSLKLSSMSRSNNWGDWGLWFVASAGAYLQDQTLFNQAVNRYKFFVNDQITAGGVMRYEVGRGDDGLWYTNFALQPLTLTAELFKVNGLNLYNYSPRLRLAYVNAAKWCHFPCSYPYWNCPTHGVGFVGYMEILNPIWPNADAVWLFGRWRPFDHRYSTPVLTLTHGGF
jgi:hypothetical protein